jgi:hypothetical protein
LPGIVLTPFIGAYHLGGVIRGSGPVKTFPKLIFDEGAWCYVMVIDAPMDVLK